MNLKDLSRKFNENEIEWRIGRAGKTKNGKLWATCLAYITNRAIMQRLDEICGIENWKNEYKLWHQDSQLCGISIKINNEWITKWDGAQNTQFDGIKGGLSDSMKRAAYQWGIGRYLYNLKNQFAIITDDGDYYQTANSKTNMPAFKWSAPKLSTNFLPAPNKKQSVSNKKIDPIELWIKQQIKIKTLTIPVVHSAIQYNFKKNEYKELTKDEQTILKKELTEIIMSNK